MKQSDIVKQLTDKELTKQLILSQSLLLILSIILSFFLFDNMIDWLDYFSINMNDFIYYGVLPGFIIVAIDLLLINILPKKYYDDGGINDRIFKNRSIKGTFSIALMVAVTEELLFRGVIQTVFGYFTASTLFALIHIRYLKKPVLLISVLFVSFYIGYMFVLTDNLFVTIIAHFTVDFVLGVIIRFQK
ncbi:MAG TPA: CPBP family intramembrane glutamic endopeptidase [Lentibacillus sp.]|uniref:CPBP family intramembrane glutamic endopeptidase n=1 Tax=Lentibacillus sp. TaxID=1925746 RepID=UPI002B4B1CA6|nr:CPBP family intramembrane glutamic endopeptidase [Lentibacillus sp.]HLR63185.1 CPBP family intramembrane glutamic endopeptidase [Lentibacillus sp.]